MKQFDSDGDLLNANGVAGMDVTGKGKSWQKLTNVSEKHRQKMFDNVKREFQKKIDHLEWKEQHYMKLIQNGEADDCNLLGRKE